MKVIEFECGAEGVSEAEVGRANRRASRLAELLRGAGVGVSLVEEATLETDAAVPLDESRHVQVSVDGTYTLVKVEGESFNFEPPATSATGIVAALAGGENQEKGRK